MERIWTDLSRSGNRGPPTEKIIATSTLKWKKKLEDQFKEIQRIKDLTQETGLWDHQKEKVNELLGDLQKYKSAMKSKSQADVVAITQIEAILAHAKDVLRIQTALSTVRDKTDAKIAAAWEKAFTTNGSLPGDTALKIARVTEAKTLVKNSRAAARHALTDLKNFKKRNPRFTNALKDLLGTSAITEKRLREFSESKPDALADYFLALMANENDFTESTYDFSKN